MLLFGSALAQSVMAQQFPSTRLKRAAIVIGVNRTGDLPLLQAAASGARQFADFLRLEGFEVKEFNDDQGKPVTASDIFSGVVELVDKGNLDQLVIYFAGHGFGLSTNFYWLLSGAPRDPSQAISVLECVYAARRTGITNVVLIGDACRSLPQSLKASNVRGTVVFPNDGPTNTEVTVDQFLASHQGEEAFEVSVSSTQYEGLFTSAFMEAFQSPDRKMAVPLSNGLWVVPNRRLRTYLRNRVQEKAQDRSLNLLQTPESIVSSDEPWYVGTTRQPPGLGGGAHSGGNGLKRKKVFDVLGSRLDDLEIPKNIGELEEIKSGAGAIASPEYSAARLLVDDISRNTVSAPFKGAGLLIRGEKLVELEVNENIRNAIGQIQNSQDSMHSGVEFEGLEAASSVVMRFSKGFGGVVAVLPGFVTTLKVGPDGIEGVQFDPARNNFRFEEFQEVSFRLQYLRSLASEANRLGVLGFGGTLEDRRKRAEEFAGRIRMLKSIDPTLGVYAAYAYKIALVDEGIDSVQSIMRSDLISGIFDVEMLAEKFTSSASGQAPWMSNTYPFCPMFRQGWELLRVEKITLNPIVEEVRSTLLPSLWTTFDDQGIKVLAEALRLGKIK